MDGDGSYPCEQIQKLVDHLLDSNLDFVSAARFPLKNPKSMNLTNKIGNTILTLAMLLLYGKRIKDSQSGMWVFRSEIYPRLEVKSNGMPFSEEIKIEAIRAKDTRFGEYQVNYHERIGEVKLRKWRDGFSNLLFLVKKRFR